MKRMTLGVAALFVGAAATVLCGAAPANADILSYTGGTTSNQSQPGEAILIPGSAGVSYTNIVFNWYTGTSPTATAFGHLYVFDEGTSFTYPGNTNNMDSGINGANLSASAYTAVAAASSNEYTFTGLTLLAGHTYYFFNDGMGTVSEDANASNPMPLDTLRYRSPGTVAPTQDFESGAGIYDFELQGTTFSSQQGVVPAPATISMLGSGALAILGWFSASRLRRSRLALQVA